MPSKKTVREGENYFATREEGEDFQELGARFTLPTRFERFVEFESGRFRKTCDWKRARKKEDDRKERKVARGRKLVVTRRNEILSIVRSIR